MHYFTLLLGPEPTGEPDAAAQAEIMAAYQNFHAKAGQAIRAGDALLPSTTGVRITGGPEKPSITDGPFVESAEAASGFYLLSAADQDEAVKIASMIPASTVELRQLAGVSRL